MIDPPDRRWSPTVSSVKHRRQHGVVERGAPRRRQVGQRVPARVAGVPARRRNVDDGVQVVGEQVTNLRQRGGISVVADDGVRIDLFGGNFEVVSASTQQCDRVAVVMELFSNGATQFGVASGDKYLHRHDLLVFSVESRCRLVWSTVAYNSEQRFSDASMVAHRNAGPWDFRACMALTFPYVTGR